MAYAIMRMEKIKDARGVTMAVQHNTRERTPPNAEPGQTGLNWMFGGASSQEILAKFNGMLPGKIRKNAVLAVELVMTASPEMKANWTKYLNACDKWATDTFGAGNLLHIAHHRDEKTPHTHILFVPLKDGKLNARAIIGGSRDRMAELQDLFWEAVGKPFGLERGKPRADTRARHTPTQLYDMEARETAIADRERAVELAAKQLDQGQRLTAIVIERMRANQLGKSDVTPVWQDTERRLADVVDQAIADRRGAVAKITPSKKRTDGRGGR